MITTNRLCCPHCGNDDIYYRWDATVWECLKCSKWFNVRLELNHTNWYWSEHQYSLNKIEQHLSVLRFSQRVFGKDRIASLYICKNCAKPFPLELATDDRCLHCLSSKIVPYIL